MKNTWFFIVLLLYSCCVPNVKAQTHTSGVSQIFPVFKFYHNEIKQDFLYYSTALLKGGIAGIYLSFNNSSSLVLEVNSQLHYANFSLNKYSIYINNIDFVLDEFCFVKNQLAVSLNFPGIINTMEILKLADSKKSSSASLNIHLTSIRKHIIDDYYMKRVFKCPFIKRAVNIITGEFQRMLSNNSICRSYSLNQLSQFELIRNRSYVLGDIVKALNNQRLLGFIY